MRNKSITRRTARLLRDMMADAVRSTASTRIATCVEHLVAGAWSVQVVGLYAAKGTEVQTSDLDAKLRARGCRVAYPRIVNDDRRLQFAEVAIDELVDGPFGLREPPLGVANLGLGAIEAFVVPGVAFDRSGGRLGWGRGYYDATLACAPSALRIGVAFECQIVDHVPSEAHDTPMHYVVTETTIHRSTRL